MMKSRDRAPDEPSRGLVPEVFERFEIKIERLGDGYRAQVTDSPVGPRPAEEVDAAFLDPGELSPGVKTGTTRDVRRRSGGHSDLRHVGERLFRAVFVGGLGEAFRASVERVRGRQAGLGIHLRLDAAPELVTLPWEALWDPTDRAYLADQPDLPVVRALGVTTPAAARDAARPPLCLLALLPEPKGEKKLSGEAEWSRILRSLGSLIEEDAIVAERLDPATLEALGKRIEDGPCHVLHVVAHGGPGGPGTGGQLKLEDVSGALDAITGGDLARALEPRSAPRLVVLNACHGARAAVDDAFDGLAQHLLSRGVPAVVAMRASITDAAAVTFAGALYRELASGRTVEGSMTVARHELSLGEHRTEWATPVLYLRGRNVKIFDPAAAGDAPPTTGEKVGRLGKNLLLGLASVVAVVAGFFLWPSSDLGPCPPPPGLSDFRFVEIAPGVVDLGDRKVIVEQAFCIATNETSRRDWLAVMGGELPRSDWPTDWPMTDVTPAAAGDFLRQLEARDPGVTYRLPTAAQWEIAARTGQVSDYFFGDDSSKLHRYGNCRNFLRPDGHDGPAAVGSYEPNAWGLHDVHGNVAEWVRWPDATPRSDDEGNQLALRLGGSYDNVPRNCSFSGSPSTVKAKIGNRPDTGFRVVRGLAPPRE